MQAEERRKAAAAMAAERAKLEEAALPLMLDAMWAANVLDIQHTVKAVCHEVHPDFKQSTYLCRLWAGSHRRSVGRMLCFLISRNTCYMRSTMCNTHHLTFLCA